MSRVVAATRKTAGSPTPASRKVASALSLIIAAVVSTAAPPPCLPADDAASTRSESSEPVGTVETPTAAAQAQFPNQISHSHPPGGMCFLEVLQAISGKKCAPKTVDMLRDVVEISREEDRIVVVRSDASSTSYPRGTEYGDSIFESLDEAEEKVAAKLGASGGSLIHNLQKISLQGKHVRFIRSGPQTLVLKVPEGKHYIPVTVKQVELGEINMDVDLEEGYPRLRNIEGVRAVVKTPGVDLPIDLREFARRKDKKGNTHLTFGVKSWIPSPVRFFFGLPAVMPFHYMIKKKHDDKDDQKQEAAAQ